MPPHGGGHGQLIPGKEGACGKGDFLDSRLLGMGADQGGVAIEQHEFMAGAELEHRLQQLPGVHPNAAVVLVVMAQHDPNAHEMIPSGGFPG